MNQELFYKLHQHARRGGKVARKRQLQRVERFVKWCGRAPAHDFAPTTARDYDSAIRLLWEIMGRAGEPPRPPNTHE